MPESLYIRLYDLLTRFILTFDKIGEDFSRPKAEGILSTEIFDHKGLLVKLFCESFDSNMAFIGIIKEDNRIKIEHIYKSKDKKYASFKIGSYFPLTSTIKESLESSSFLSWDSESVSVKKAECVVMNKLKIHAYSVCPFKDFNKQKVLIICNRKSRIDELDYYDSYEGKLCKIILEIVANVKTNERIRELQNDYEKAQNITGSRMDLLRATEALIHESIEIFPKKKLPDDELMADYLDSKLSLLLVPTNMSRFGICAEIDNFESEFQSWFEKWESLSDKKRRTYQLTALSLLKVFYALKAMQPGNNYAHKINELHAFLEKK